jgi:LytR cell envelope-related transcriptional attenuator
MEPRSLIALAATIALAACLTDKPTPTRATAAGTVTETSGDRVRVEVLNASTVHGLARRATRYLRDRGFDVVISGTAPARRDSTVVIDRTRHPVWAGRVARAFGGARVESHPDSSRYVDVTVLLGATWRPPPQPFYP